MNKSHEHKTPPSTNPVMSALLMCSRNTPVNCLEIHADVNLADTSFQRGGKKAAKQIFSQLAGEKWSSSVCRKIQKKTAHPRRLQHNNKGRLSLLCVSGHATFPEVAQISRHTVTKGRARVIR